MGSPDEELATEDQIAQLRELAGTDEEIPDGMRAAEAAQRINELRTSS